MPYGIPKEAGGESTANVARMEACVRALMEKGHDKVSAIKICKAKLFGSKG